MKVEATCVAPLFLLFFEFSTKSFYICTVKTIKQRIMRKQTKNVAYDSPALKKALLVLLQDVESFEKLSKYSTRINIFDVLKISRTEILHNNMLGWLLDPNESHGLKDAFLYGVLARLSDSIPDDDAVAQLLTCNLSSFNIYRERYNIDILLVSSEAKIVIAIENKFGAKDTLAKHYGDYTKIMVYLTPYGDRPTETDWVVMDYHDIYDVLTAVVINKENDLPDESKVLINNYIEIIKRQIIMDKDLVQLCNDIYRKHKIALDLIYENIVDRALQISKICREVLSKIEGVEVDERSTKTAVKFTTRILRETFDDMAGLSEAFYQIQIRDEGASVLLERVFHKEKEAQIPDYEMINTFISKSSAKINDDKWEWKRASRKDMKNADEKTDEQISSWLAKEVDKMIREEEKLVSE